MIRKINKHSNIYILTYYRKRPNDNMDDPVLDNVSTITTEDGATGGDIKGLKNDVDYDYVYADMNKGSMCSEIVLEKGNINKGIEAGIENPYYSKAVEAGEAPAYESVLEPGDCGYMASDHGPGPIYVNTSSMNYEMPKGQNAMKSQSFGNPIYENLANCVIERST